jgi:hypothetical protein
MELSPSWKAASCAVNLRISPTFYGIRKFITVFTIAHKAYLCSRNVVKKQHGLPLRWRNKGEQDLDVFTNICEWNKCLGTHSNLVWRYVGVEWLLNVLCIEEVLSLILLLESHRGWGSWLSSDSPSKCLKLGHYLEGQRKTTKRSIRILGVEAENRTGNLPKTIQKCYRLRKFTLWNVYSKMWPLVWRLFTTHSPSDV